MPDNVTTKLRHSSGSSATRIRGRAPTAADLREFGEAATVQPFTPDMLPDAERKQAESAAAAATGLMLKAMFHRMDPAAYPVPADADSPEAAAKAALDEIDDETFARLVPKVRALAADRPRLTRLLSPLGRDVDLRRPSLELQRLRPLIRAERLDPQAKEGTAEGSAPVKVKIVRKPAKYRSMDFVLRAVHCVRETSGGGADEIILGAVLVGASGNTNVVPARYIGDFDDGTYISTGDLPFGKFSLRTTNGYPKTMYCILEMVESDQDDADAARGLTTALSAIVNIVVSAWATPAAGAAAGAIVTAIGNFIGIFISDDAFPPYGVMVRLDSEDQFGADGMSGKLATGDIRGHGGAYRIGYRIVMNA